jgi:ribosomal protein L34E
MHKNQYDSRSTKSKVKRTHAGRGADAGERQGRPRTLGGRPYGVFCCENGISTWSAIVIAQSNLEHCIAFEEGFNES